MQYIKYHTHCLDEHVFIQFVLQRTCLLRLNINVFKFLSTLPRFIMEQKTNSISSVRSRSSRSTRRRNGSSSSTCRGISSGSSNSSYRSSIRNANIDSINNSSKKAKLFKLASALSKYSNVVIEAKQKLNTIQPGR